jgi:hypothetical protein
MREKQEIGYRKSYKMRIIVPGRKHIVVAIPYEFIERQAALRELTVKEFVAKFEAVAEYNGFEGIKYTFREAK